MKLKKSVKRSLIIIFVAIIVGIICYFLFKNFSNQKSNDTVKVVDSISKYGYSLKENKTKTYKDMFNELKLILNEKEVNDEEYAKKISEMFIYDFYSLDDKKAKTDVGGVDFVYNKVLPNFLQNAQDTYYKYVENNIYNNRKQKLPVVTNIKIEQIEQKLFTYGEKNDDKAYYVNVNWSYTDDSFSSYQKAATLVFIHDDIKLSLVELKKI